MLPPLLTAAKDVYGFHLPPSQPNYITQKSITAPTPSIADPPERFAEDTVHPERRSRLRLGLHPRKSAAS